MNSAIVILHGAQHYERTTAMIYAIIPFQQPDKEKLRKKFEELGFPVYADEAPIVYFVSYKGTTRELAEAGRCFCSESRLAQRYTAYCVL